MAKYMDFEERFVTAVCGAASVMLGGAMLLAAIDFLPRQLWGPQISSLALALAFAALALLCGGLGIGMLWSVAASWWQGVRSQRRP